MSFHPPGPQFPRLQNGRKNIYSRGPCGNGTGGHTEPRVRRACGRGGCKQSRAVGPDSGHLAPRSCWPASVPEANPAHPLALDMAKKIIGPQPVGRNPEKQTHSPVARRCRRLRLQAGAADGGQARRTIKGAGGRFAAPRLGAPLPWEKYRSFMCMSAGYETRTFSRLKETHPDLWKALPHSSLDSVSRPTACESQRLNLGRSYPRNCI